MTRFCISLLAVLVFVGCGGGEDSEAVSGLELEGRSFTAETVDGRELVPGSTLQVTFEEGRIGFAADCNQMSVSYELLDGKLEPQGEIISTMMACAENLMEQDEWLADFFAAGPSVSAPDDSSLRLEGDDATIELSETG